MKWRKKCKYTNSTCKRNSIGKKSTRDSNKWDTRRKCKPSNRDKRKFPFHMVLPWEGQECSHLHKIMDTNLVELLNRKMSFSKRLDRQLWWLVGSMMLIKIQLSMREWFLKSSIGFSRRECIISISNDKIHIMREEILIMSLLEKILKNTCTKCKSMSTMLWKLVLN